MSSETTVKGNNTTWLRPLIGSIIILLLGWFLLGQSQLTWNDVEVALRSANPFWIAIGLLVILITNALKARRWQRLFHPATIQPRWSEAFWALQLNQFVNNVVLGRLGEVARAYTIPNNTAQALGTIIVEKSLETIFLGLTLFSLLPWAVLPHNLQQSALPLIFLTTFTLITLYSFAFQGDRLMKLTTQIAKRLPTVIGRRLLHITQSALQGLASLRNPRAMLEQLTLSTLIAILYVLTPYVLFRTFKLPYTLTDAVLLHLSILLITAPPSTPGSIGVFEWGTTTLLGKLNPTVPYANLLSYAIIYHLVVLLPPLLLGGIAAWRSDWGWQRLNKE